MENIRVVVHLTEEAQGKQGIRIECEDEIVFDQIYKKILTIQPRISEDRIFKTTKRLIVDVNYINDLVKLAEELLKINSLKYRDFFNDILIVKNKIYINEQSFSNYPRFK